MIKRSNLKALVLAGALTAGLAATSHAIDGPQISWALENIHGMKAGFEASTDDVEDPDSVYFSPRLYADFQFAAAVIVTLKVDNFRGESGMRTVWETDPITPDDRSIARRHTTMKISVSGGKITGAVVSAEAGYSEGRQSLLYPRKNAWSFFKGSATISQRGSYECTTVSEYDAGETDVSGMTRKQIVLLAKNTCSTARFLAFSQLFKKNALAEALPTVEVDVEFELARMRSEGVMPGQEAYFNFLSQRHKTRKIRNFRDRCMPDVVLSFDDGETIGPVPRTWSQWYQEMGGGGHAEGGFGGEGF